MLKLSLPLVVAGFLAASVAAASAWTPPAVGAACAGSRKGQPRADAVAGNFLGGRPVRHGVVDRLSFQGCFASLASCENWLAEKAVRYPLGPGFARCTPVALR